MTWCTCGNPSGEIYVQHGRVDCFDCRGVLTELPEKWQHVWQMFKRYNGPLIEQRIEELFQHE